MSSPAILELGDQSLDEAKLRTEWAFLKKRGHKEITHHPTGSKGWNPEKIPRKFLEQDVIVGVARVVVCAESNIARQGDARLF